MRPINLAALYLRNLYLVCLYNNVIMSYHNDSSCDTRYYFVEASLPWGSKWTCNNNKLCLFMYHLKITKTVYNTALTHKLQEKSYDNYFYKYNLKFNTIYIYNISSSSFIIWLQYFTNLVVFLRLSQPIATSLVLRPFLIMRWTAGDESSKKAGFV